MSDWQTQRIESGGIRLAVTRAGGDQAGKPPLVLLHGITDNGLCWRRLAESLAADYDVIMPDARGHGESDAPEVGYSADDHAADVAGLIQVLGLDRVLLAGHSMGAMTAAVVAADYPDLVRALVVEDPPWWMNDMSDIDRAQVMDDWRQRINEQRAVPPQVLRAAIRADAPAWHEDDLDDWVESKHKVSPNVVGHIAEPGRPWQKIVPWITCPTLLIYADANLGGIVTPKVAAEVKRLLPGVRVVHLPGAGHNIRREQFEGYREVVAAFLAEVTAQG